MKYFLGAIVGLVIGLSISLVKASLVIDSMAEQQKVLLCYRAYGNGYLWPFQVNTCTFIKRPKFFEEVK